MTRSLFARSALFGSPAGPLPLSMLFGVPSLYGAILLAMPSPLFSFVALALVSLLCIFLTQHYGARDVTFRLSNMVTLVVLVGLGHTLYTGPSQPEFAVVKLILCVALVAACLGLQQRRQVELRLP